MDLALHWAVAVVLIFAAIWDARTARIPNALVMVLIALYAGALFRDPSTFDIWQLAFAGAVFACGFVLFAIGAVGAGAVKLASAAALFMPLDGLGLLGLAFLGAMIVSLVGIGALRGLMGHEDSAWACLRKRIIPMAVPIALTGLVGLFAI